MKDIIKQWLEWKEGKDDGYIYDEIHEFFAQLSRGEMCEIMAHLEELK